MKKSQLVQRRHLFRKCLGNVVQCLMEGSIHNSVRGGVVGLLFNGRRHLVELCNNILSSECIQRVFVLRLQSKVVSHSVSLETIIQTNKTSDR